VLVRYALVEGVHETELSPVYLINIALPSGKIFEAVNVVVGANLQKNEALIGMSIINQGDFAVTNVNNKTTMSYRSPSVCRINFKTEYEKALQEEKECHRKQNKATRKTQKKRKRRKPAGR